MVCDHVHAWMEMAMCGRSIFSETVMKSTLSGSFGPRRPADGNAFFFVAKELLSSTVQSPASFP
jgi:hypothetical protein